MTLIVPESLRAFLLTRYHSLPISGHKGKDKTLYAIKLRYFWPKMERDILKWIRSCPTCAKRKTPRHLKLRPPASVSTATRPWQHLLIDLVTGGAADDSVAPAQYILTILCLFTRYVVATPIVSKSARDVAEALLTNASAIHGRTISIRSDEGKKNVNAGLLALYRRWDIEAITTDGWRAWANPIERYHRYFNSGMSHLSTTFGEEDWPSYFQAIVFSYNASVSRSTGYSPYILFYGREPTILEEIAMSHPHVDAVPADDIASIQTRMSRAYAYAITQQERVAKLNRQRYEDGYHAVIYKTGDHVLCWEPAQSKLIAPTKQVQNAWKPRWTGPHLVTAVAPGQFGDRYAIMHVDRNVTIANVKSDRLSPYQPWSDALPSIAPDLDALSRSFQIGTWCQPGSLFIIALAYPYPFGIGKVLTANDDGTITFQWYNTLGQQSNGSYLPSWWNGTVRYDAEEPANATHVPIQAAMRTNRANLRNVINGSQLYVKA